MRAYGKVETGFWRNPKVRLLSKDARHLMLYLIACPHGNAVGCFELPKGYVEADVEWVSETLSELFAELMRYGFIERQEPSGLTRIVGWWGHNAIENGNVAVSIGKTLRTIPRGSILVNAINDLEQYRKRFGDRWETDIEPLRKPMPNGMAIPEPEPEPEPETDAGRNRSPPTPGGDLAREFIALRRQHWPDDPSFAAPTLTLEIQAQSWLDGGMPEAMIRETVSRGMAGMASKGLHSPKSFDVFKRSLGDTLTKHRGAGSGGPAAGAPLLSEDELDRIERRLRNGPEPSPQASPRGSAP